MRCLAMFEGVQKFKGLLKIFAVHVVEGLAQVQVETVGKGGQALFDDGFCFFQDALPMVKHAQS